MMLRNQRQKWTLRALPTELNGYLCGATTNRTSITPRAREHSNSTGSGRFIIIPYNCTCILHWTMTPNIKLYNLFLSSFHIWLNKEVHFKSLFSTLNMYYNWQATHLWEAIPTRSRWSQRCKTFVRPLGLEPKTHGLKARCSTNWAKSANLFISNKLISESYRTIMFHQKLRVEILPHW